MIENLSYINPENGLLYCKVCEMPKEIKRIESGVVKTYPLKCTCEMNELRHREKFEKLKQIAFDDLSLTKNTFAHDDGSNQNTEKAQIYVENWYEMFNKNIGLMLFGDVGTGKSFIAACIANALIEKNVSVRMTNFSNILTTLSDFNEKDRSKYLDELVSYDLLIIDDFGIERDTEYAVEQVYTVINKRYLTKKPLIITTNISYNAIVDKDVPMKYKRIYDRINEMCQPVLFKGKNYRDDIANEKRRKMKELLGGK